MTVASEESVKTVSAANRFTTIMLYYSIGNSARRVCCCPRVLRRPRLELHF